MPSCYYWLFLSGWAPSVSPKNLFPAFRNYARKIMWINNCIWQQFTPPQKSAFPATKACLSDSLMTKQKLPEICRFYDVMRFPRILAPGKSARKKISAWKISWRTVFECERKEMVKVTREREKERKSCRLNKNKRRGMGDWLTNNDRSHFRHLNETKRGTIFSISFPFFLLLRFSS